MQWQTHFGEVFFREWEKVGFPDPKNYTQKYLDIRRSLVFRSEYYNDTYNTVPALEKSLTDSIYAFGAIHGKIFKNLLCKNRSGSIKTHDWCGRFNLGISLLDYLIDETPDGIKRVMNLASLQSFVSNTISEKGVLNSPIETFLNNLIRDILIDVDKIEIIIEGEPNLMESLKELFDAQLFLFNSGMQNDVDFNKIYMAMHSKSAKPFSLMVKFALLNSSKFDYKSYQKAVKFGNCIGKCYWLVDDAKDLVIDIDNDDWNLFALKAMECNPKLVLESTQESKSSRIQRILVSEGVAKTVSKDLMNEISSVIPDLEAPKDDILDAMGLIGAALWFWHLT